MRQRDPSRAGTVGLLEAWENAGPVIKGLLGAPSEEEGVRMGLLSDQFQEALRSGNRRGMAGALAQQASIIAPYMMGAGMTTPRGPKLSASEWADQLKNSKARKKLSPDRREAIQENKAAISEVRAVRDSYGVNTDPLTQFGGGENRMRVLLDKKRKTSLRESVAQQYGVDPSVIPEWADEARALEFARSAANNNANVKKISAIASEGLWSKSFSDDAAKYAGSDVSANYVNRANLEAVPRILKKEGWEMRHSSSGKDGRKSSRYLVSPDGSYEVRLSDHYLPQTPQRETSSTRWNDEMVLSGDESPTQILDDIRQMWRENE